MDKFARQFFSMKMMAFGMFIFLIAIGAATFIESIYDIQTAKMFIYNAFWFELLLAYLGVNLIANIFTYRMIPRKQWATFTFHVSFVVILLGAAITRFISFEGTMQVPEGQQSNIIHSAEPYFIFRINDGEKQYRNQYWDNEPLLLSPSDWWNDFSIDVDFPNHETPIQIDYVDFQKNMVDSLVVNDSIQGTTIEFVIQGQSQYLSEDDFVMWGDLAVSYNKKDAMPGLEITRKGRKLLVRAMLEVTALPMSALQTMDRNNPDIPDSLYTTLPMDTLVPLEMATLYSVGKVQFVFKDLKQNTKMMKMPSGRRDVGKDFLTVRVTDGKHSKLVDLEGGMQQFPTPEIFEMNGLQYVMEYGSKRIDVPFSIMCRDFQLDRYPGSSSASSFASEVTIIDEEKNFREDKRIFMNHFMDYRGYRFFQSSYFPDETGTILSVNHDYLGTMVTYIGYLLMTIGMLLSLFNKTGRFRELNGFLKKSNEKRAKLTSVIVALLMVTGFVQAQEHDHDHDHAGHDHAHHTEQPVSRPSTDAVFRIMSKEHSEEFEDMLVQDYQGRIAPMHTLCNQLLRKIHRSNTYKDYNAIQTIISMHMYRDHWMNEKMIYVSYKGGLREKLETEKYVSYSDLFHPRTGQFILIEDYNKAHQKLESKRSEYDKQLIKLNEKAQVVNGIFQWYYMRILPLAEDGNNKWFVPLDEELIKVDTVSSPMALRYFSALNHASEVNAYGEATDLLSAFKKFQRAEGKKVAPGESVIGMEISYNKMGIFKNSWRMYLSFGFILLLVFFVRIFARPDRKPSKILKTIGTVVVILLGVVFLYHGAGLVMRSYITGYMPWSNGYEAMIFIGWVVVLVGFLFAKKNPVILAGTAILAFLIIFVSEMSLLDPEITPLVPVLKSYWLKIHVAVITGSYAPLGLGCILAILNLILYIFRNKKNGELVTININELTYITEMLLTIGVFMLTIGTFLGGVWANESWGRYWGWDPKETWALVAVLVYGVILHLRFIPGLKGKFLFNVVSMWGYVSILFTFFGVNFYLVGLHSYAQGEGLAEIPMGLVYTFLVFVAFTAIAAYRNKQYSRSLKN